jgi:hypothetical protein
MSGFALHAAKQTADADVSAVALKNLAAAA